MKHAKFAASDVNGTRLLVESPIPGTNFTLERKSFSSPLLVAEDVRRVILESDFFVDNTASLSYSEAEIQFFR